ncbi:VOC family protein [Streptosporangium sp. NPDC023963]|uniref:VOC family protein n=1 Tax=Streptosporangium sp. NPDC023963 TaxID=3155608 RepID=UPI0034457E92
MPEELLDHLVYATPDLHATVREIADLLGAEPAEGGRHVGLGTRNYLLGLGGHRYLEIIGPDPDQPDPGLARPFGLDLLPGPRLVTWAIHPADLDAAVARARERGYEPGEIHPMSRRTPEGELLEWRLTSSPDDTGDGLVPFLIDWGTTAHPAERGLPVVELTSLTARHPDPAAVTADLAALGAELEVAAGDEPRLVAVVGGVTLF